MRTLMPATHRTLTDFLARCGPSGCFSRPDGFGIDAHAPSSAFKEEVRLNDTETTREPNRPDALKKLTGLYLIGRELTGRSDIRDKMQAIVSHVRGSLDLPEDALVWIELDGEVYGTEWHEHRHAGPVGEILADDRVRGRLCVARVNSTDSETEYKGFLNEAADLIGRHVESADHERALAQSERRYRKLAGNLAQEMWCRTEALAKETGYLEGILRSSDDMIVTTDLEARIVEFNPGAEKILGYSAEEVQGRDVKDFWEDAEERCRLMDKVFATGGIRNYETRLKTKSGEMREVSLTLSLLKDEEGRTLGTVGVSKDITKEKAIRTELERLNQNFRETIHFISHESKNSLIVIAGFVRRLLEAETDEKKKEQLQIVYHHAKFLEAMTRDFLVMADLERGELRVRKIQITDFYSQVILPAMLGLKERYPDSFESYDTSMGGVGAIRLMGDPALLEIVYRNLFGNALKYRGAGGKVSYGVEERGDSYLFNVWNEGPGVGLDQVEKVFDKFYRADDENTKSKRGTGLGLYNIRQIIDAHGGKIWCETRPGYWINFLFILPKK